MMSLAATAYPPFFGKVNACLSESPRLAEDRRDNRRQPDPMVAEDSAKYAVGEPTDQYAHQVDHEHVKAAVTERPAVRII
jgi:hypothetical protein